jgi:hypothetical protein
MTEVEKARKRTRRNWKKDTKAKYRILMYLAKQQINNATKKYCYVKRHSSRNEYFALWLVAKKLEAKGFKCELEKGEWTFSEILYYDTLTINWE